ncbi:MAG TPA: ribose-phosphate diphosphokinase [Polyangiaceae bacterium]|nr:ribose-phosphate diphosphokinase [Polyangiaceae bacterium]
MKDSDCLVLGSNSGTLGRALLAASGSATPAHLERFADGETHVSLEPWVRGRRVVLLQSLSGTVGERLLELALLADAARRGGAREAIAVIPYLGYARQERREHDAEALGAKVVARLLDSCGFDRILCVDLHTPAIEGFFSCPVNNLTTVTLFIDALRPFTQGAVLVAPDLGAAKLVRGYARRLELPFAVVQKTRLSAQKVEQGEVRGDVRGLRPIIIDDIISTGATIAAALDAVAAAGAKSEAVVVASHGLFAPGAAELLESRSVRRVIVTDSVEPLADPSRLPIERVSLAPLVTEALLGLAPS